MLRLFAGLALALTAADHWTTWLCLRAPVEGWTVREANPIADWLFSWAGLNGGLVVDSLLTLGAVAFLVTTRSFGRPVRVGLLAAISAATAFAVGNNLSAISRMGLAPWSGGA